MSLIPSLYKKLKTQNALKNFLTKVTNKLSIFAGISCQPYNKYEPGAVFQMYIIIS